MTWRDHISEFNWSGSQSIRFRSQERMKALALGEEVEKPMNVHRWRHLEGTDPAAHELLLQTQALQRRLIAQTEVCCVLMTSSKDY